MVFLLIYFGGDKAFLLGNACSGFRIMTVIHVFTRKIVLSVFFIIISINVSFMYSSVSILSHDKKIIKYHNNKEGWVTSRKNKTESKLILKMKNVEF